MSWKLSSQSPKLSRLSPNISAIAAKLSIMSYKLSIMSSKLSALGTAIELPPMLLARGLGATETTKTNVTKSRVMPRIACSGRKAYRHNNERALTHACLIIDVNDVV